LVFKRKIKQKLEVTLKLLTVLHEPLPSDEEETEQNIIRLKEIKAIRKAD
jgi:hypothetical protein